MWNLWSQLRYHTYQHWNPLVEHSASFTIHYICSSNLRPPCLMTFDQVCFKVSPDNTCNTEIVWVLIMKKMGHLMYFTGPWFKIPVNSLEFIHRSICIYHNLINHIPTGQSCFSSGTQPLCLHDWRVIALEKRGLHTSYYQILNVSQFFMFYQP